jgi:glycolate oxidase FAD binding subunit
VLGGAGAAARWRALAGPPRQGADVTLKITHLPAELPSVLKRVDEAAERSSMSARVRAQLGNGVLVVEASGGEPARVVELISDLRTGVREGSVVVLEAPREVKRRIDAWGPVGDALPLMRKVKERFDPAGVLNPGRFVGGI